MGVIKMREILFRGKRTFCNEWVYGDLVHYPDRVKIDTHETGQPWRGYDVFPETVGQFTGMTDENGAKIFEGDIVRYSQMLLAGEEYEHKDPVLYLEGGFTVGVYFLNHWLRDIADGNVQLEGIEVIGNIHDIPVLLKKVDTNGWF